MSLALTCSCGTQFEVPDGLAGQVVSCPECQTAVAAPLAPRVPLRTSGYALASVLFALVGAFTIVGTVAAILLGAIALVSIARNRERIAGTGYALFGMLAGLAFTALSLLAYSSAELFEADSWMRGQVMSSQVDTSGDLEVTRSKDGFAITRFSRRWGVAKPGLMKQFESEANLLLVHPGKDAYVEVHVEDLAGQTLEEYHDQLIQLYAQSEQIDIFGIKQVGKAPEYKVLKKERLPPREGLESAELVLDMRQGPMQIRFIERIVRETNGPRAYRVRAWASRNRFASVELELRAVLDSFRLLPR